MRYLYLKKEIIMARAKHRWKRKQAQMWALVNKVERQRKHQEMLKEHENIKKSGRSYNNSEEVNTTTE
jgi:hypothetical protein